MIDLILDHEGQVTERKWPDVTYPLKFFYEWKCSCGLVHISKFHAHEPGDCDYDGFNFTCECGAYYKKFWRVPESWYLRKWLQLVSPALYDHRGYGIK